MQRNLRNCHKGKQKMKTGVRKNDDCRFIHATHCVIIVGASPRGTKMWAAVRENGDFFALAVRITGKVLKIDEYMVRCYDKH